MTVGAEVVLAETVMIVDGEHIETVLSGTKGIVKRIGYNGTVALLVGCAIYPDIPIASIKQVGSEKL